jgi:hypothetical protein
MSHCIETPMLAQNIIWVLTVGLGMCAIVIMSDVIPSFMERSRDMYVTCAVRHRTEKRS